MRCSFIVVAALLTLLGCGPAPEATEQEDTGRVEETSVKLQQESFELRRRHSRRGSKHHHHGKYGGGYGHHGGGHGHGGHGHGHDHDHGSWGDDDDEECEKERFRIDGPYVDAGNLCVGGQVSVTASVEATQNAEALVYVTIRNREQEVVFERFFVQSFESGSEYDFEATFLTDAATPAGKYFVSVRVVDAETDEVLALSETQRFRLLGSESRRCIGNCGPDRS